VEAVTVGPQLDAAIESEAVSHHALVSIVGEFEPGVHSEGLELHRA
jgi:hypothetical protein